MTVSTVSGYFNKISSTYNSYKSRNSSYYIALKKIIVNEVGRGGRVLDYGCGTGQILVYLNPSLGVGYDISPGMIRIAKKDYKGSKELKFVSKLEEVKGKYDWVIMADVVEHTPDLERDFRQIKKYIKKEGKLLVTFVGPFWEPVLMLLERFDLKMPEGPHRRLDAQEVIIKARLSGFRLKNRSSWWWPITKLVFVID